MARPSWRGVAIVGSAALLVSLALVPRSVPAGAADPTATSAAVTDAVAWLKSQQLTAPPQYAGSFERSGFRIRSSVLP